MRAGRGVVEREGLTGVAPNWLWLSKTVIVLSKKNVLNQNTNEFPIKLKNTKRLCSVLKQI